MDPLCDDALAVLYPDPKQSTGHDLLETLLDSPHPVSVAFIQHISLAPPPSIAATPDQLHRARRFGFEYSGPILRSFLHFSLVGGFARCVLFIAFPLSSADLTSDTGASLALESPRSFVPSPTWSQSPIPV
jgi:hypothetical protein